MANYKPEATTALEDIKENGFTQTDAGILSVDHDGIFLHMPSVIEIQFKTVEAGIAFTLNKVLDKSQIKSIAISTHTDRNGDYQYKEIYTSL